MVFIYIPNEIKISEEDQIIYYYWSKKQIFFQISINEKENLQEFFDFLENNKHQIQKGNNYDFYHLYRVKDTFGFRLVK